MIGDKIDFNRINVNGYDMVEEFLDAYPMIRYKVIHTTDTGYILFQFADYPSSMSQDKIDKFLLKLRTIFVEKIENPSTFKHIWMGFLEKQK